MKQMHVISGLPRSGSTLLCNLLNQNPDFWATSTSMLPMSLANIGHTWSNSIEVKAMLEQNKADTEQRLKDTMLAFVEAWHNYKGKNVVFDKSRAWTSNALMLRQLYPDCKIIVTVRDLRNVFASVEKQHRKNPILDEAADLNAKSIYSRANEMFSPGGLIGTPLIGIEDIIRRKMEGIVFVQYETFVSQPKMVMEKLYAEIGEEPYKHNYDNVVNTATDPDGFYLYKYPHHGEGKVVPSNPDEWKEFYTEDLAQIIMAKFADYNKLFDYV